MLQRVEKRRVGYIKKINIKVTNKYKTRKLRNVN